LRRQIILILACTLYPHIITQSSAAVSSSDLRTMRTELNIDQYSWIQNAKVQLPEAWRDNIYTKSRKLIMDEQYQAALDDLLRVDKLIPSPSINLQLAICYAHLQRKKEALALMSNIPDSVWKYTADIYATLGLYDEAIAACADPTMIFDEPVLIKSSLLLAHGDREGAIRAAKEQYWHEVRINGDSDKLASFLKELNVELTPPPQIKTFNPPVNTFLKKLSKLKAPTTLVELERTFDRKFIVHLIDAWSLKEKHLNAEAPRQAHNKFSYVQLDHHVYDPSVSINVSLGVESTFITVEEVRQILQNEGLGSITEETDSGTTCDHCNGKIFGGGTQLNCTGKDAQLQFSFLRNGQLSKIQKTWNKNPAELKEYKIAIVPVDFREKDLDVISTKIASGEYRDAARELLKSWSSVDQGQTELAHIYEVRYRKRDLLVRCYIGMNRSDIADYLKSAPLDHIRNLAVQAQLPLDEIFPTYDEYVKTKWKVTGNSSQPDGGYYIWSSACQFDIHHDSPLFPKFYALLGPMLANRETKVPPLPGTLVDDLSYASGR
jgi:hypothetical protein